MSRLYRQSTESFLRNAIVASLLVLTTQVAIRAHAQNESGVDSPVLADAPVGATLLVDTSDPASAHSAPMALNDTAAVDTQDRTAVIAFYQSQRAVAANERVTWTGSQSSCVAGDTPQAAKDAILRRINFFRAMAGVPEIIGLNAAYNAQAQQAALMMSANNALSHTPPTTWKCHSAQGATAARNSNLLLGGTGPDGIDLYMHDFGSNNAAVGHRRWLLYPQSKEMGTGDVPSGNGYRASNALWVFDNPNMWSARPAVRDGFVAWPPPGYVPHPVVYGRWSFSYPGANFASARITMTRNGTVLPVRVEANANGYGENTLVWVPNNMPDSAVWPKPAADEPIQVSIENVVIGGQARNFSYTVTVIDATVNNTAPSAIALSAQRVQENLPIGSVIAQLTASDVDAGDTHSFTLQTGAGDTHNYLFAIEGRNLISRAAIDFESTPALSARIQARDRFGATVVQTLMLQVDNIDEAPQFASNRIMLTSDVISQTVSALDPEGGQVSIELLAIPNGITATVKGNKIELRGNTTALIASPARLSVRLSDGTNSADITLELVVARNTVLLPLLRR
jgi:uncharacterized protein YkwD